MHMGMGQAGQHNECVVVKASIIRLHVCQESMECSLRLFLDPMLFAPSSGLWCSTL